MSGSEPTEEDPSPDDGTADSGVSKPTADSDAQTGSEATSGSGSAPAAELEPTALEPAETESTETESTETESTETESTETESTETESAETESAETESTETESTETESAEMQSGGCVSSAGESGSETESAAGDDDLQSASEPAEDESGSARSDGETESRTSSPVERTDSPMGAGDSADSGSADSGSADSGSADSGSADAGSADSGSADSGSADSGNSATEGRRSRGRRIGVFDHLIGLGLCAAYVALLLATSLDIGMARDEGFYVTAADRYGDWFEILFEDADQAMTREAVDRAWGYNHEHPSLVKGGFALVRLADQAWEIFDQPSMSYRFFGMLTGGLLLWLIYIFGARVFGRQAGVFAALAFALIPRIFYHAHLDCFDIPIVFMMTLVTYCYWRSLSDWRWVILTGLSYGLALETKHNAWTLPAIFLVHWLFVVFHERRARRAGKAKRVSYVPWWLIAMLALGPPIFVALWPWMWWDTATRFGEYAGFHLNHVHYNMAYFGVNYYRPPLPMGFPWVMTLYTVPLATLALAVAGVGSRLRTLLPPGLLERLWPNGTVKPDRTRTDVLLFGAMMAPLVVISMPWTPIFGGTKHWFSAYPFLAMFAGAAFVWVARNVTARLPAKVPARRYVARVAAGLLLLSPAMAETVHSHPFGLSHYGFAAGGVPGAADDGMNRQFWGFTTRSLVPFFNEQLADGGTVWICDMTPTAFRMMQQDGLLSDRVRATGDLIRADYAIVHHEHHFFEVDYQIWTAWGDVSPAHVLTYDGVPIVSVYENPRRRARRDAE
ncbi:MAG: glycosyltransferase family 39 protein [Sandaracinaceae bacterium]